MDMREWREKAYATKRVMCPRLWWSAFLHAHCVATNQKRTHGRVICNRGVTCLGSFEMWHTHAHTDIIRESADERRHQLIWESGMICDVLLSWWSVAMGLIHSHVMEVWMHNNAYKKKSMTLLIYRMRPTTFSNFAFKPTQLSEEGCRCKDDGGKWYQSNLCDLNAIVGTLQLHVCLHSLSCICYKFCAPITLR